VDIISDAEVLPGTTFRVKNLDERITVTSLVASKQSRNNKFPSCIFRVLFSCPIASDSGLFYFSLPLKTVSRPALVTKNRLVENQTP